MQDLQKELPHGSMTGFRIGREHCGHCISRTMTRALRCGSTALGGDLVEAASFIGASLVSGPR